MQEKCENSQLPGKLHAAPCTFSSNLWTSIVLGILAVAAIATVEDAVAGVVVVVDVEAES